MKYLRILTGLMLLFVLATGLSPAHAQPVVDIRVDVEPPPLVEYDQPPIPDDGYIWVPGYWAWSDDVGYYWVPGTWVLPPEPELLWTPGYWGWSDGFYFFHPGYWGPTVGFYGGVNYGFGYGGLGYEGGYWRDHRFFYNRSINNFGNASIRNVYNKTVIVNNTSRTSFNGGPNGIQERPTPEQRAAAEQRHIAATPAQTNHIQAAARDPSLSLRNNHGTPAVAATAHPGEFKGPGVVQPHPGTALQERPAVLQERPGAGERIPTGQPNAPALREQRPLGANPGRPAVQNTPEVKPSTPPARPAVTPPPQHAAPTPPRPPAPPPHAAPPPPRPAAAAPRAAPPPPPRPAPPPPPRPAPPPAPKKCPAGQKC
jgi:hypothetical protein